MAPISGLGITITILLSLASNSRTLELAQTLKDFLEEVVGAKHFAEELGKASTKQVERDGNALVLEMEQTISGHLSSVERAVTRMKNAIESNAVDSTTVTTSECCSTDMIEFQYNEKLNAKVNFGGACMAGEKGKHLDESTEKLLNVAALNLDSIGSVRTQRFVGANGVMIQYPATISTVFCEPKNYAASPWYISTVLSGNKDIVMILDAAIFEQDYSAAMKITELFSKTIHRADNFGLVVFSDEAEVATTSGDFIGCERRTLVPGTEDNLNSMFAWLKKQKWEGTGASYTKAFQAAFDYFDSSRSQSTSRNKRKLILFATKTPPDDASGDILKTLTERNRALHDNVAILTFDMTSESETELLTSVATASGGGSYTRVNNMDELETKLMSYYQMVAPTHPQLTHWDQPRYERTAVEMGMIITASQPVVIDGEVKGAVSVDVSVARLIEDATINLPHNNNTYAFVMDENFKVISHPFLKPPSTYAYHLPAVDIRSLENSDGLDDLLMRIKEGSKSDSFNRSVLRDTIKATWREKKDGMAFEEYVLRDAEVYCKSTSNSLFTICVVVRSGFHSEPVIHGQTIPEDFNFVYHRLDYVKPKNECSHLGKTSYLGTTVHLSADAFVDTPKYTGNKENKNVIEGYSNDVTNELGAVIVDPARQDIFLTFGLEELWRETDKNMRETHLGKIVIWRYVATKNGVFRIWPGAQLPKDFDPRERPWFRQATTYLNSALTFTTPLMDVITGTWIISVFRAVTLPTVTPLQGVYAVIGFDIQLKDFQGFLQAMEERCENFCSLAHPSGYMVYHPEMMWDNEDLKGHLTEFDPNLSQYLSDQGIIEKHTCYEHERRLEINFYAFDLDELPTVGVAYGIESLDETNVILLYTENRDMWYNLADCVYQRWEECRSNNACPTPCLNYTKPNCGVISPRKDVQPCATLPRSYEYNTSVREDLEACYDHLESVFDWMKYLKWLKLLEHSWVLFALPGVFAGCYFLKRSQNEQQQTGTSPMGMNGMNQTGMMTQNGMGAVNFGNQEIQPPPGTGIQPQFPLPGPGILPQNHWTNQSIQAPQGYGGSPNQIGYPGDQGLPFSGISPQTYSPPTPFQENQGFVPPPPYSPPTTGQSPHGF